MVAWSPEVIAALADAFVGVVGGAEREGSPDGGVLDLCAFESSLVLEVLGTDEASLKDERDCQHAQ